MNSRNSQNQFTVGENEMVSCLLKSVGWVSAGERNDLSGVIVMFDLLTRVSYAGT